ncbi:MAG: hypothetical protein ACYSTZ_12375, partial [Planctomycetota bacterium]
MKENNRQNRKRAGRSRTAKRLAWLLILVIVAGGAVAYAYLHARGGNSKRSIIKAGTYTVQRGDLTVSVTENGDIKPLNSLVIKSKVEKRSTTIISIVDEGTYIT